ncbi:hypothetical protein KY495_02220 [Massilia sp. PAMC28688]|uniref:hypothetical protein n=1 Tax=Massilia sp. PAMC28688 TaxID=2861283 RepID=UPI001C63268A|nr:hypothetical protein [Massilia sp. PAMC28688]QYF94076.1 hypothetical protein KY495_02220 [Massilia sp. PAMC28688]
MLQTVYSQSPLDYARVLDHGEPEPRTITRSVERAAPAYFAMLSQAERGKQKLERSVNVRGRDVATVVLSRPDTDHQVEYLFRRTAGCWQLQRISDHSL